MSSMSASTSSSTLSPSIQPPTPTDAATLSITSLLTSTSTLTSSPKRRVADKWVKPNGPPVGVTFGARLLRDEDDVFNHNAWDHVTLPEDFKEKAEEIMKLHQANPVSASKREAYNTYPASYWNEFYKSHQEGFFKDRGWLRLEYPELIACSEADAGPKVVLEVGCGAGNTIFPLMMHNENPDLVVYATDYSKTAIDVVKANPMYPVPEHGRGIVHASVWDLTSTANGTSSLAEASSDFSLPEGIIPGSVDVITVIFVLSALHPNEWEQAIHNLWTALKPNGLLCIRDYGRHDLAQLRIKKDRLLDPATPNLYIRGDGTRVYFFEKEELGGMLTAPPRSGEDRTEQEQTKSMFEIHQLGEDRRMLVNRKEKLKMYRIWLQVKARKSV